MIEKNTNMFNNRTVEYDSISKQVNLLDQRFYHKDGKFYPSVTMILSFFPKDRFFENWLKDVGHNAEYIAQKAAWEGTQVHQAIERMLIRKQPLQWLDDEGNALYPLEVWKMILKFADFWNTTKPELIACEYHIFSDTHQYAGTIDLVVRIKDELWLIDIKTSNSLHDSYDAQLSAYTKAWNESHEEPIKRAGIIWLKSSKRMNKEDKLQGKGWEIREIEDIDGNFDIFLNIYKIFAKKNPNLSPDSERIPTVVELL
jgi:ATP-dependent exoDNAse (exonuclease V) beta subunit